MVISVFIKMFRYEKLSKNITNIKRKSQELKKKYDI